MRAFRQFIFIVLAVYTLLVIAPVIAFLDAAMRGGLAADTWTELWRQATRTTLLRNSVLLSALTTAGAMLLGVPLGFLLARTDVAARRLLTLLCVAPLFLPPFLWAIAWQATWPGSGLTGLTGAVWVLTLALFPLVALLAAVGFAHVSPELEDDCRTLAGEWGVFWHVTLPLARPLVLTGALLVFVLALGEFGTPALLELNVYPVAVFTAFSAFYDFGQAATMCLPLVVVTALLAWATGRAMRDMDFTSLTTNWQARRLRLGRARLATSATALFLLGGAVGAPLLALMARVSRGATGAGWREAAATLGRSWALAVCGAIVLAVGGLLVGWLWQRRYARGSAGWLYAQVLLFVLPGAVVGLGLVSLWNRPVLGAAYGTSAMIVLGYLARFAPLTVRAAAAFVEQLPRECEEAIWLDGGGAVATFRHFILPASRRVLLALAALSFVLCMGELGTTILVAPAGSQTLAVRLFTIEANAPQSQTASVALVLVASCLAPLALAAVLLRRKEPP